MSPIHICFIIFFTVSTKFWFIKKKICQGKCRYCLTGLTDKCRNSQIFHSSWCGIANVSLRKETRKPGEVTQELLWCLGRGAQLVGFERVEDVLLCTTTWCLYFCVISGASAAKKHVLKEHTNLNQSSVAQQRAPVVRLLGVQQRRCLRLSQRSHPTLQSR